MMGQDIMYIEYKDGRSVKEELDNVKNISFHHMDELPADPIITDISRGLLAYYTFDNENANDNQNRYHGFLTSGSFITDTPNGEGHALFLKRGETMNIPYSTFSNSRNYTISIWVKDFGSGCLFKTFDNSYLYGPSLYITEEIKARFHTGVSWSSDNYRTFNVDLTKNQSEKWTMITVVTRTEANSSKGTCDIYINGQYMESATLWTNGNEGATTMAIGGYFNAWADPMKVDNLRLYDVALDQNEIASIYQKEKQPAIISLSSQKLFFDKNTDKQYITINNKSLRLTEYSLSSSLDIVGLSSVNSYIPAKGSKTIEVSIKDRDKLDTYAMGSITIESEGMYYSVDVQIEKGKDAPTVSEEVSRGLQAYYKFDDTTITDSRNGYNGTLEGVGTFISDTPNGKGKALSLRKGDFATIAYAPFDTKRNYAVSLWAKDFGTGFLFRCYDDYTYGPSLEITEDMRLKLYSGVSWSNDNHKTFSTNLSKFQSEEWVMLTIVTSTEGTDSQGTISLYVNGQKADSKKTYTNNNNGATAMSISNANSDPMKIDNIRLYSVALTDAEVMEIYNAEKK